MKIFKAAFFILAMTALTSQADEVSKKACEQFLPALGPNNIDIILNGIKRDFKESPKGEARFNEILKAVNTLVSDDAQKRCDAGLFPIINLDVCYMKCKTEVEKTITGTFAWNYQDRWANQNKCYEACTGAYVAQNAITKSIRKTIADQAQCSTSTNVLDSRKSKQIENILLNIDQGEASKNVSK